MNDTLEQIEEQSEEGSVEEQVEATADLSEGTDNSGGEDLTEPATEDSEETPEQEAPTRLKFEDRAEAMGLTPMGLEGCFHYSDAFSEVVYRTLQTGGGAGLIDDLVVPPVALFTKPAGIDGDFSYIGIISQSYKFEGNEVLINRIRESIGAVGTPILSETTFMTYNLASIRHEVVIQNATNVPQVGDIYPQLLVTNSYDGTKAAHVTFGLAFNDGAVDIRFSSKEKLGSMRQIHLEGAATTMQAEVGGYIEAFGANIGDMVEANFNNHITEDDMLKVLDMVEKSAGRKRREAIAESVTEGQTEGIESWSMTSWQLFNAITKFSTLEKNLNAKTILEDIAERVLVVPAQMMEAVAILHQASPGN